MAGRRNRALNAPTLAERRAAFDVSLETIALGAPQTQADALQAVAVALIAAKQTGNLMAVRTKIVRAFLGEGCELGESCAFHRALEELQWAGDQLSTLGMEIAGLARIRRSGGE